jgi:hypothetical protein
VWAPSIGATARPRDNRRVIAIRRKVACGTQGAVYAGAPDGREVPSEQEHSASRSPKGHPYGMVGALPTLRPQPSARSTHCRRGIPPAQAMPPARRHLLTHNRLEHLKATVRALESVHVRLIA